MTESLINRCFCDGWWFQRPGNVFVILISQLGLSFQIGLNVKCVKPPIRLYDRTFPETVRSEPAKTYDAKHSKQSKTELPIPCFWF